jgi:hypothetical protein
MTRNEVKEAFEHLDNLRQTGVTNMFGATPYIVIKWGCPDDVARKILSTWMNTPISPTRIDDALPQLEGVSV